MTLTRIHLGASLRTACALLLLAVGFAPPAVAAPEARRNHVAIYDPVRHRMLVWGGGNGSTEYMDEVWSLNLDGSTPTWSTLSLVPSTGHPPGAYEASAVYDPVGDRMVVFGGQTGGTAYAQLWTLKLSGVTSPYQAEWTQVTLTGSSTPGARYFHSAVYDPVGQRMIVYGGVVSGSNTSEVWSISLASTTTGACTLITSSGTPGARAKHLAFYDPKYQRMLVSGGNGAPDGGVYALQLTGTGAGTWSTPYGIYGNTRVEAQGAYDTWLNEFAIWDGSNSGKVYVARDYTDAGTMSTDNQVPVTGGATPYSHTGMSAIFDPCPAHPRIVMFGGTSSVSGVCDDLVALTMLENPNDVRWNSLTTCPTVPGVTDLAASNGRHSMVLQWSGVANQSPYGAALSYEVRSSTNGTLTDDNFNSGDLVGWYDHLGVGEPHCAEILDLPSCTHYDYAVRVRYADLTRSVLATASATTRCTGSVEVACSFEAQTAPPPATDADESLGLSLASGRRVAYVVPAALDGVPFDLALYDVRGRRLRTLGHGAASAQRHVVDLGAAARGIYFVRLDIGGARRTLTVPVLD